MAQVLSGGNLILWLYIFVRRRSFCACDRVFIFGFLAQWQSDRLLTDIYKFDSFKTRYSPTMGKFRTKGMFNIVLISKEEKNYLVSKGIRFGTNGISHTVPKSKARTYYLCENPHNMRLLNEYRKRILAK